MSPLSFVVSIFVVSCVSAAEYSVEITEHATNFVQTVCDKLETNERFLNYIKCKKDGGIDPATSFSSCVEELQTVITEPDSPDVGFRHACKQDTLEKRVELVSCCISKDMAQGDGTLEQQKQQDSMCLESL